MQPLAIAFLVTLAIGGLGWVFIYPLLSGERRVEERRAGVARATPTRTVRSSSRSRRDQVEETLKEIDARTKASKRVSLTVRLAQAGLTWSKQRFYVTSGLLGLGGFFGFTLTGLGLIPAVGVGFSAGFGLPFWILGFLKKRREAKFLAGFPDAMDIIVRGIKSGLPVMDCLNVIA